MGTRLLIPLALLALGFAPLAACVVKRSSTAVVENPGFVLTSPVFLHQETVPTRHTCDGEDISPPLKWSEPPAGTKSFLLKVHDPDAPISGGWTHWILAGIPGTFRSLPEALPGGKHIEHGLRQRPNSWGRRAYGGPCPPPGHGRHRYFFRLYALDVEPGAEVSDSEAGERALATATLMGYYGR